MAAFDRLSPAVRHQIVNALGFTGLRPVPAPSIDAILDGRSCVILAPTAGNKTKSALFLVLSALEMEGWDPLSVLYVAPIKRLAQPP